MQSACNQSSICLSKNPHATWFTQLHSAGFTNPSTRSICRATLPNMPTKPIGEMEYFSVLNDHLTDGAHPEAPYNKLASDHGQIMAHLHIHD